MLASTTEKQRWNAVHSSAGSPLEAFLLLVNFLNNTKKLKRLVFVGKKELGKNFKGKLQNK